MASVNKCYPVKKHIFHPGTGDVPYPNGTKVIFHLRAEALPLDCDLAKTTFPPSPELQCDLIDDSRQWKQPVELLLGKQFKLEILEESVKNMKTGELSAFFIDKKLLATYPVVSQTLRKALSKNPPPAEKESGHRCCGMGVKEGLGHADLDALVVQPRHMKFTVELLSAELPGSYEKQYWEMSEGERLASVPVLREQGNALYKQGQHQQAALKYKEALGRLENLMLREKPGDEDWQQLNAMKLPLLLNYSQCELLNKEYYSVVEHCTTVLQYQPDNVKALFRRGKAYVELCEASAARADLTRCSELDPPSAASCNRLLGKLASDQKKYNERDKKVYGALFTSSGQHKDQAKDSGAGDHRKESDSEKEYIF
ncbi:Tetratricopeptide-like helical domain [Trinorchestia longiramus]|nr:Tetratricopeptide-like helical domain [Trinorchestia longiramus]